MYWINAPQHPSTRRLRSFRPGDRSNSRQLLAARWKKTSHWNGDLLVLQSAVTTDTLLYIYIEAILILSTHHPHTLSYLNERHLRLWFLAQDFWKWLESLRWGRDFMAAEDILLVRPWLMNSNWGCWPSCCSCICCIALLAGTVVASSFGSRYDCSCVAGSMAPK